jgi:hypothetical protein
MDDDDDFDLFGAIDGIVEQYKQNKVPLNDCIVFKILSFSYGTQLDEPFLSYYNRLAITVHTILCRAITSRTAAPKTQVVYSRIQVLQLPMQPGSSQTMDRSHLQASSSRAIMLPIPRASDSSRALRGNNHRAQATLPGQSQRSRAHGSRMATLAHRGMSSVRLSPQQAPQQQRCPYMAPNTPDSLMQNGLHSSRSHQRKTPP